MFLGRDRELSLLRDFQKRQSAGLIVCRGRRRIGKSTLIETFGENKIFYEFYGLAPREGITNEHQLKHFGELMGTAFDLPPLRFDTWHNALTTLAGLTSKGQAIILLDEISWMASRDKDFAGKLKGVWDTKFKKNKKMILILCGSVTSWIDNNILNNRGFMGRVSLTITLDELSLYHSNKFWPRSKHVSPSEKLKLLCVTGGVPRYLEEIRPDQTAEQNIKRICFSPEGLLFSEFDKIFRDIFESRSDSFLRIVRTLADGPMQPSEICKALGVKPTGDLSEQLSILTTSGMIARDYSWNMSGKKTRLSKYRIRDNYLRFYLKYIEPEKDKIEHGLYHDIHLENLIKWNTIMGYQFENLILNNLQTIIRRLDIPPESIISASPYFQRRTQRQESCQIDLLIHTKYTLYVCEIRFRKLIDHSVTHEIIEKTRKLKGTRGLSIRPVLVHQGKLSPQIRRSNIFSSIISFKELLLKP